MAWKYTETKEQLAAEAEVATRCEKAWHCVFHKLFYSYTVDYAAWRITESITKKDKLLRKIFAWVEVKCRYNINMADCLLHGFYGIALHKLNQGLVLAKQTEMPFYIVIRFQNGEIYWAQITELPKDIVIGGRMDRKNNSQDIEPMALIPIEKFYGLEIMPALIKQEEKTNEVPALPA